VLVYVTVRVTISLTWRTLDRVGFGDLTSKYRPLLWGSQSNGERALLALKGERMVEFVALKGESALEYAGDAGMRRRLNCAVEGAEEGWTKGFGVVEVGDL